MLDEKRCRRPALAHDGMRDEPAEERHVRDHALDLGLVERLGEPVERVGPALAVRDELCDQRVVREADLVTLVGARVDPDRAGKAQPVDAPCLREEGARVLRIQPDLDRVAARAGGIDGRLFAAGDPQLLLDEIDAADELCDRMLDLDAPVELKKPEVATVDHELGGAGTRVADLMRESHRRVSHSLAQVVVERGRRRLLEHLLVAPLDRAFPLAEGYDLAGRRAEELNLDVPRPLDVALAEDAVVAERSGCLAAGRRERVLELAGRADDAHAAAAAARGRLDDEREPDLVRIALRDDRNGGAAGDLLRAELVAAAAKRVGRRSDEDEPSLRDLLCECRAFREEAVARMDRVGPALRGRTYVLCSVQVGRDLDDVVGDAGMERPEVIGSGDGDRPDTEAPGGAEDPDGDLAPVGDEQGPHARRTAKRVARQHADRSRYGTASLVARARRPPAAAPRA